MLARMKISPGMEGGREGGILFPSPPLAQFVFVDWSLWTEFGWMHSSANVSVDHEKPVPRLSSFLPFGNEIRSLAQEVSDLCVVEVVVCSMNLTCPTIYNMIQIC